MVCENATPESKEESISGAALLDTILAFIRRFVSLSEAQARVLTLFVLHTHAFVAAFATPYMAVTSVAMRSGKTRLLEVLALLVASPWMTGRTTAAALVRKIDSECPTLLLDESDAAFKGEQEYAEALRGVLNSGHERGGMASLCVRRGADFEVTNFKVFCAKVIAGIGDLPGTVADRAIPIRLKRKTRDEKVERFRKRNVEAETTKIREQASAWVAPLIQELSEVRPSLPEELTDRQQDGAEPLLAIADAAGGHWPETARRAFIELCNDGTPVEDSVGEKLLTDIRQILGSLDAGSISSADLVAALSDIETSPWGEWSNGKPISKAKVARLLRSFGIFPTGIRIGEKTPKGYAREDFQDAFSRYLGPENSIGLSDSAFRTATSATPNNPNDLAHISDRNKEIDVTVQKTEIAKAGAACGGVALSNPIVESGEPHDASPADHSGCAGCYVVDEETGAKIHPPKHGTHGASGENQ